MDITIAHSPDSDDAFMFYALASGRIDTGIYRIKHVLKDIETLNSAAAEGQYEVSAVSLHAFPFISNRYKLLSSGASVGDNYGPIVVSKTPYSLSDFQKEFSKKGSDLIVGIPGEKTTAFLVLRLLLGDFRFKALPFDQIIPACLQNEISAGLIIHEGQLQFQDQGLKKVVDLGAWWRTETGLPLPLGGNVIRKDLGDEHIREVGTLIRRSIAFSLAEENRPEALRYAMQFSRGLDEAKAERFVRMYVNKRTLDYDPECLKAINLLYDRASAKGYIAKQPPIETQIAG